MSKTLRRGHQVNQAFGLVANKPKSKIPGTDRGQFSKLPEGPSVGVSAAGPKVHKARGARLKGVII